MAVIFRSDMGGLSPSRFKAAVLRVQEFKLFCPISDSDHFSFTFALDRLQSIGEVKVKAI